QRPQGLRSHRWRASDRDLPDHLREAHGNHEVRVVPKDLGPRSPDQARRGRRMTSTLDILLKAQENSPLLKAALNDTSHSGASIIRKQLSNWIPHRAPADFDLLPDLPTLVGRARDLNRNNGVAAGALQTLQDNVAGTGLRLAANPDYRAL